MSELAKVIDLPLQRSCFTCTHVAYLTDRFGTETWCSLDSSPIDSETQAAQCPDYHKEQE